MSIISRIARLCAKSVALFLGSVVFAIVYVLFLLFITPKLGLEVHDSNFQAEVNDVTKLNPIPVVSIHRPESLAEIVEIVKSSKGAVSIGGGKFSMGGQTASVDTAHIDLRSYKKILAFSKENKEITVESGATWRDLQEYIDPHDLSIAVMQSYSNFSVGGTLSVNAHGRYNGYGAIVHTVKSLKLVLADGAIQETSRKQRPELFFAAIGGYGGIGLIAEVTLQLEDNTAIERSMDKIAPDSYLDYFRKEIEPDKSIIMHNGDLLPPNYDLVYVANWSKSKSELTNVERIQHRGSDPLLYKVYRWVLDLPFGKHLRPLLERVRANTKAVVWRNYEASYDVASLGEISNLQGSFVLQEYFVPINSFSEFRQNMTEILNKYNVDVVNISIRHALADKDTFLSWSPEESFAFVLYYYQPADKPSLRLAQKWTRELIDKVNSYGGKYYLPYLIHATSEQFQKAYSRSAEFFALKDKLDPSYKFRNSLWDTYYRPSLKTKIKQAYSDVSTPYREEDQSFLTLPEWLLVFMSKDQAESYSSREAQGFAYFKAIGDFWSTYLNSLVYTRLRYPGINWEYHIVNITIGISTTIEYGIKGVYESTIGNLFSVFEKETPCHVEKFIGKTYSDYASFIHHTPWYQFDFSTKLSELSKIGAGFNLRSIERKYSFMLELYIKKIYASLLGSGTKSVFESPKEYTYAVVRGDLGSLENSELELELVREISTNVALLRLPRYHSFSEVLLKLRGFELLNVAGNSNIAVSIKVPENCALKDLDRPTLYNVESWSGSASRRVAKVLRVDQAISYINSTPCLSEVHLYDF